jgi:hypothetical protein
MTGGSRRSVAVTSEPAGAEFAIADSSGQVVASGTTPTEVTLKPGAGYFRPAKYTVTFTTAGCTPVQKTIKTGLNGWYCVGNFFFGGLIGWLVVDPLTGAMWTLERTCNAELTPAATSSTPNTDNLKVVCLDSVPDHLRQHLRRVK